MPVASFEQIQARLLIYQILLLDYETTSLLNLAADPGKTMNEAAASYPLHRRYFYLVGFLFYNLECPDDAVIQPW